MAQLWRVWSRSANFLPCYGAIAGRIPKPSAPNATSDSPQSAQSPMSRFFFGMIVGASLLYVAMHFHVVRGKQGVFLVSKISNNLSDVYVDTREFSLSDWQQHKPLAAAIMKSNQTQLLEDSSLTGFRSSVSGLVDGLFGDR